MIFKKYFKFCNKKESLKIVPVHGPLYTIVQYCRTLIVQNITVHNINMHNQSVIPSSLSYYNFICAQ